jgi:hypothetical protein
VSESISGEAMRFPIQIVALHLIARMEDHDLWMAFFEDRDGHTLAVMQEAPKAYVPPK